MIIDAELPVFDTVQVQNCTLVLTASFLFSSVV